MPDTDDAPDPWALLPSETVCRARPDGSPGCNLARHKHLPECPTCRVERPTPTPEPVQ